MNEERSMNKDIAMTPHELEVNGIHLHYVTWGQFSQPERAVMLVPGLTSNHQEWSQLGPTLAKHGWYAIAPDLRGRGWSDRPAHGYGVAYHVNDLLALCDALGLQRVHLIGHSLGALIDFFLAFAHPNRVGRLVAVDAGVGAYLSEHINDILGPALARLGQVYKSMDDYLQAVRQSTSSVHPWNDFWEAYYRYGAEVLPNGQVTPRASVVAIAEEIRVNSTIRPQGLMEPKPPLTPIMAPTLITRAGLGTGQPDWFVLTNEEVEYLKSHIADCRVVEIPDGNHYTIILSEVFAQEVLTFLAKASATKQE